MTRVREAVVDHNKQQEVVVDNLKEKVNKIVVEEERFKQTLEQTQAAVQKMMGKYLVRFLRKNYRIFIEPSKLHSPQMLSLSIG